MCNAFYVSPGALIVIIAKGPLKCPPHPIFTILTSHKTLLTQLFPLTGAGVGVGNGGGQVVSVVVKD